jgi:dTMP kinase
MFITFEGIEGSGKSTQARLLSEYLSKNGIKNVLTKEPGEAEIPVCSNIRKILLDPKNDICPKAELFLFLADRAQHIDRFIIPHLNCGKWVICDRFTDSTLAYQGARKVIDMSNAEGSILYAEDIQPDLTILMDLPAEEGLQRALKSNVEFSGGDRMESEGISFHKKVRGIFLGLAQENKRFIVVDARKSVENVHKHIVEIFKEHI